MTGFEESERGHVAGDSDPPLPCCCARTQLSAQHGRVFKKWGPLPSCYTHAEWDRPSMVWCLSCIHKRHFIKTKLSRSLRFVYVLINGFICFGNVIPLYLFNVSYRVSDPHNTINDCVFIDSSHSLRHVGGRQLRPPSRYAAVTQRGRTEAQACPLQLKCKFVICYYAKQWKNKMYISKTATINSCRVLATYKIWTVARLHATVFHVQSYTCCVSLHK